MQVYILHFSDSSHYTGITTRSIIDRLYEHEHNSRSYVRQKRRLGIGYTVASIYETEKATDERFYKRNVKRYCKVCKGETSVST